MRLVSRDGSEEARVAVLPFVPERRVVDACLVMGPEGGWYEEYARRIEQILAALVKDLTPATVNLVLGHLLVDGARRGTGERELHLGQVYGVNPQQLPASVQYIGLGHLHRPQEITAPSKTLLRGLADRAGLRRAGAGEARGRVRGEARPAGRGRVGAGRGGPPAARGRPARSRSCALRPRSWATRSCASR